MCVHLGIEPGSALYGRERRVRVHISRAVRTWASMQLRAGGNPATWHKVASWPFGGFLRVESMESTWFKEPPHLEPAGDLTYPGTVLRVPVYELTGPGVHNAVDRWGNTRQPVLSPAA